MPSPTFDINGVACSIALDDLGDKAIVERWPADSPPEADVAIKCAWADRGQVIAGLRGTVVAAGRTITRIPPFRYPGNTFLICTSIGDTKGIKWKTRPDGWGQYQDVILPVHFSVPVWDFQGFDLSNNNYISTAIRTSAEVFHPPIGAFYYEGGAYAAKPVAESSVAIIKSRADIQVTRRLMPFVPLTSILQYQGSVNSAPFTFGDRAFPTGCLLFTGCDISPGADLVTGARTWDIVFGFLGQYVIEWNKYLDPKGTWQYVNSASDGSGVRPFAYVNFSALFGNVF